MFCPGDGSWVAVSAQTNVAPAPVSTGCNVMDRTLVPRSWFKSFQEPWVLLELHDEVIRGGSTTHVISGLQAW